MNVSVALAAKDGALFLSAQVESILLQLDEARGDELIISTDPSADATKEIAAGFAQKHPHVKHISGPGKGAQANFEYALNACTGSHIFLSDQDDIWMPDKVEQVRKAFEASGAALIVHDARIVDEQLQLLSPSYFALRKSGPGTLKNIYKNSYMGCCMAVEAQVLDAALPFPPHIPMHDQWLGLVAQRHLAVHFLPMQLVQYRRHDNTVTSGTHATIGQMIEWRYNLMKALKKQSKALK